MTPAALPIAIVGAGFSGTLTALQLLSRTATRPILLCERGERFARGVAYGTADPGHLLNVRASNMSAFPDRPNDLVDWLARSGPHHQQVQATSAGTFVSRHLYGTYVTSLLRDAIAGGEGARRLILVPDEVVDIVPDADGYSLVLAVGKAIRIAGAVLATGHGVGAGPQHGPVVADPWSSAFGAGLDPARPVVVVGSGLTMVDIALQLRHTGFEGPVIAISRRGLVPHTHAATSWWPTPLFTPEEQASPSRLLGRLRREAAAAEASGIGWRSVVDSVRSIAAALWQGLDQDAQRRFLRHARPWWDVHRHRMAVPVGAEIEALVRHGLLDVRAGCIKTIAATEGGATVTYRPRGEAASRVIDAQQVFDATGGRAPDRCGSVLLQKLLERRLARLDRHGLGLDLDPGFGVIGASGAVSPRLWALGPLGMGVLWECTAVPNIREHAVEVAERVAMALDADAKTDDDDAVRLACGVRRGRQRRTGRALDPP